ncbi:hypothetical protein V8C42DRAFT_348229 [Trichoderma barbatum]
MQQKTDQDEISRASPTAPPKRIDIGKHKTERHLCGTESNQQALRESGDDRIGESLPLPEANGKSKSASKLKNNESHLMALQGSSFLAGDGPWYSVPLSSDDEKWEIVCTTKMNTKDSEAEQQMAKDGNDVSQKDAYARIEHGYVNLGSEDGSELSDAWDERTVYVGSRDSRSKKVRR